MEFEEIAPCIIVYKNVINNYEGLVSEIEDLAMSEPVFFWKAAGSYSNGESVIEIDHRDTDQIYLPYPWQEINTLERNTLSKSSLLTLKLHESFSTCESHYKSKFNAVTLKHEGYAILRYGVGQKFNSHVDDHPDFTRRVSTVYYANDAYEGGEISFKNFGISYKPKANEMLVFPSNYVYMHSVNPVISGTRYAIVSWLN